MPISPITKPAKHLEAQYVNFNFKDYIDTITKNVAKSVKELPNFKHMKNFNHLWAAILKQEDEKLQDKNYLASLIKEEQLRRNKYDLAFYETYNFEVGDTPDNRFTLHFDIARLDQDIKQNNALIEITQVDLDEDFISYADEEIKDEELLKRKLLDNRPLYIGIIPFINKTYNVIDGNTRINAKKTSGTTKYNAVIVNDTARYLSFDIDKVFYSYLCDLYALVESLENHKNHDEVWRESQIYRLIH
ncbi:hypothetical protein ABFY54_30365 [Priestia megaterium]|uniref:hypothetical protein n=1 Tax=Priestia megaterium TaxID=1404 RepID=UPI003D2DDE28